MGPLRGSDGGCEGRPHVRGLYASRSRRDYSFEGARVPATITHAPHAAQTRQAALEQAAGKGALNIVRFLLNSAPASTQQIDRCLPLAFPSMAKAREPDLGGPLVAAAASGHDLVALDLLGRGAPVNSINDSGNSALMAACRGSHASTVRLLVARGADVSYVSPTGASAFVFAVMGDQDSHFAALPFACLEIAMVLAYVGADIYTCNAVPRITRHPTALTCACSGCRRARAWCSEPWASPAVACCSTSAASTSGG